MNGINVLKTIFEALEMQQYDEDRQYLSGDFVMTGWAAQPLNCHSPGQAG